jgi:hypothetical protein
LHSSCGLHPRLKNTNMTYSPSTGRRPRRRRATKRIRGLSDRTIAWIFVAPTIFLLLAVNIFHFDLDDPAELAAIFDRPE